MGEEIAEPDYVEPDLSDMRRSRQINADMVSKLADQAEENKEERKRAAVNPIRPRAA